ncbi:MAG: diacylglycerol kinase family protein [Chthoniobacterales bacterium]
MRALLLTNPDSGDTDTGNSDAIRAALATAPFTMELAEIHGENDAATFARRAVADHFDIVLVSGGDGTVSEVARQLVHSDVILGIIPSGTFNNIARSLRIPSALAAACAVILDNHATRIDVGLANNSRVFFEAAGAGLDAALFPLGEEIKGGHWTRWLQFLRTAFHYRAPRFHLTFDRSIDEALAPGSRRKYTTRERRSHTLHHRALFVVAANGPFYGAGFTVSPGANLTDGLFTISLFRRFTKWELLRHFHSIFRGKRRHSSKIETFTAGRVTINALVPVPAHVDGVAFGETPLTLETLPGALRVFTPRGAA